MRSCSLITSGLLRRGFPCGSAGKESACNSGDLGLIPGLGRSSGEGKGYPLQYSGLENSMDYIFHGVAKSRMQLSEFHLYSFTHAPVFLSLQHQLFPLLDFFHQPTINIFLLKSYFFHFKRKSILLVPLLSSYSTFVSICFKKNSLKKLCNFFPSKFFPLLFPWNHSKEASAFITQNKSTVASTLLCQWLIVSPHLTCPVCNIGNCYLHLLSGNKCLTWLPFPWFSFSLLAAAFLFFIWSLFIVVLSKHLVCPRV